MKEYEPIYAWRSSSSPAPFNELLREIFHAVGDSEGLLRMRETDQEAADICNALHEMVNVKGIDPNSPEARKIREKRPDLFSQQSPGLSKQLSPKLKERYAILKQKEGLTIEDYASLWECTRRTATQSVSALYRTGLIRKVKIRGVKRDIVHYYPSSH